MTRVCDWLVEKLDGEGWCDENGCTVSNGDEFVTVYRKGYGFEIIAGVHRTNKRDIEIFDSCITREDGYEADEQIAVDWLRDNLEDMQETLAMRIFSTFNNDK